MTPLEIQTELRSMAKEIGARCDITTHIGSDLFDKKPLYGAIYPYGLTGRVTLSVREDDWPQLLQSLRGEWEKYQNRHREQMTQDMALAIIRITQQHGQCTDAALRAEFDAGVVACWADDACKLADEMADKGPFSIIRLSGANAA